MSNPSDLLRSFLIHVILWLPFCFFVWFYTAPFLVLPIGAMLDFSLETLLPGTVLSVMQNGFVFEVFTSLPPPVDTQMGEQQLGLLSLDVNPMIYGYGFPLVCGLTLATPLTVPKRLLQIFLGYLAILLIQTWGVFWQTIKIIAFEMGPGGAAAVERAGVSADATALAYQFGYLILPAIIPMFFWISMNRHFLEKLIGNSAWNRKRRK